MRRPAAGSRRTVLIWRLEALFLVLFWRVVGVMSPDAASTTGSFLARRIGPYLRKHRRIRRNLAVVCPERSPAEIERLARGVWGNFGALLAEFPHLGTICDRSGAHVEVRNHAPTDTATPKIFAPAHLANWELVTRLVVQMNLPFLAIYSPADNPLIERLVQAKRRVPGSTFVPKSGGMQSAAAQLRRGGCVGLLPDQRTSGGRLIEFFGCPAETTDAPARLAVGLGADLIPVRVERQDRARFRVTFCEPVRADDPAAPRDERVLDMTRKLQALFEAWIRERPEQWFCTKRRWQRDRGARSRRSAAGDGSGDPA